MLILEIILERWCKVWEKFPYDLKFSAHLFFRCSKWQLTLEKMQAHLIIQIKKEQSWPVFQNDFRMSLYDLYHPKRLLCVEMKFFPLLLSLTHLKWFFFFKGKYFVSEITENKSSWKLELNRSWQRFLKVSLNLLYSYFLPPLYLSSPSYFLYLNWF